MSAQTESKEALLSCDQCDRKDLRGRIGAAMHKRRSHGANWSTKKKAAH